MDTNIIEVAYLKRIATTKDGKSSIYSKTIKSVLDGQAAMNEPSYKVLKYDNYTKNYKAMKPGIYPIALPYESAAYTDDVFRYGNVIFVDIDTTEFADEAFSRADELKSMMPSMVALWYSLRNKLHFAFLRPWQNNIEFGAYWKLITDELLRCVGEMFGKDVAEIWRKANDNTLSTYKHLMSAGYTKGFKWYDEAEIFDAEIEAKEKAIRKYEYRKIPSVKPEPYSLFTDEKVMKKWKSSRDVKSFVKWCDKNRDYKYHIQDREYEFKMETVNGEQYKIWRNDGTVHKLKIRGGKMPDWRKRHISGAAILAASFCGASFEETLYSASKYYIENCVEYDARYEHENHESEKDIILSKAEYASANVERNIKMAEANGYLLEERQMIVEPIEGYMFNDEKAKVRSAVKNADRKKKFLELYEQGDNLAVMTLKMRANGYPKISDNVTYKVASECGIQLDKPENKYKGKYDYGDKYKDKYDYGDRYKGRYRYAWDIEGKKTMVKPDRIDNVHLFPTKKAAENYRVGKATESLIESGEIKRVSITINEEM